MSNDNEVKEVLEDVQEILEELEEKDDLSFVSLFECKTKKDARAWLKDYCDRNKLDPTKFALPAEINHFLSSLH